MMFVTHRSRSTLLALPLACLLAGLAACGSAGSPKPKPSQPVGPAPSVTSLTAGPASPTVAASQIASASAAVSAQASIAAPASRSATTQPPVSTRCATGQLRVSVTPGDHAAGHQSLLIVFTNISARSCTMYGYPGVSFVTGSSGKQINDPARRTGGPPSMVKLAPSGKATAALLMVNIGNYATESCKPVQAAGLRIYPPDETAALFAASIQQVCSVNGTGVAQIYPVQPAG